MTNIEYRCNTCGVFHHGEYSKEHCSELCHKLDIIGYEEGGF